LIIATEYVVRPQASVAKPGSVPATSARFALVGAARDDEAFERAWARQRGGGRIGLLQPFMMGGAAAVPNNHP
jgi:hypothetical protein